MDDLVAEFLTETNESLAELDNDLVNLEQNPNDQELLGNIFRLVHTIKGTCGFLGLPRLEKVAHHGENVLGRFRDGDLEVKPEYVTLIFECMDRIRSIIIELENTGSEPEGDDSTLIAKLDAVYEGKDIETVAPVEDRVVGMATEEELEAAFQAAPGPEEMAVMQVEDPKEENVIPLASPALEQNDQAPAEDTSAEKKDGAAPGVSQQSLRVSVDVLENLMTMVSELVLTRNQLLQILRTQSETEFSGPLQRLNHVVSDLQEGVMKTRMQPIGNAWAKLPRIIRDLSMELNKKIELEMNGQDTELDRQVLELIKDPLTHMVRNSADHGIEDPETRKAAGKPETGKVVLNAYHEGGHIIIEIKDDGKGLAADKIKEKALEKGLASAAELAEMTTQQIQQFIFKAGFSTAAAVTAVSGRGVGMDVVRTNIEKIGGSIELKSVEGKGSDFIIKIPLTLAIVSALIVEASHERFAIPQLSVRELVMTSEHAENQIEMIKGTPVFRLRDKLLPLVSLSDLLELYLSPEDLAAKAAAVEALEEENRAAIADALAASQEQNSAKQFIDQANDAAASDAENAESASDVTPKKTSSENASARHKNKYIVVTQVGNYDFGIIVDRVFDTEEIVVKPVAKILKNIEIFSGNTILGDGSVIMILDPNGIARATGEVEGTDNKDAIEDSARQTSTSAQKTSLLLFRVGDATPKAVPLSLVSRLENVKLNDIEYSSGKMMVQYRDQLMQLEKFDNSLELGEHDEKPVLVFADGDKSLGLIVDEIVDITEEHIDVQIKGHREGLLGSAIINEKATDVVDVGHYLSANTQNWFEGDTSVFGEEADTGKRRVLLVDDSPFFRNMLTPLLSVAGYEVTTTEGPQEALQLCEKGAHFDIIVSDIEMPEMDGFQFAEKVKSNSNWRDTPLVALTSHANPKDIDRGMEVGFNKYIAKFDRDTLLSTLSQTLAEKDNAA